MIRFRTLKILCKFRKRAWDNTAVPEIRLEGSWLERLGFEIGGEVRIKEENKKLTITITAGKKREKKSLHQPDSPNMNTVLTKPTAQKPLIGKPIAK